MESALNYKDCDIKYMFVHVPERCLNNMFSANISLSQTLSMRKTVLKILFEISRFRLV